MKDNETAIEKILSAVREAPPVIPPGELCRSSNVADCAFFG